MEKNAVKTTFQREREAREMAIYNEKKEMMSVPGAMATAVDQILMKKYHLHSRATIWATMKRVEERKQKVENKPIV